MTADDFKAWRKQCGFNQAEAADAIGLSRGSVENYERGSRREDGRAVEVPATVALACEAVRLKMAVMTNRPALLTTELRAFVYQAAYALSIPTSGPALDQSFKSFDTMHESLQDAGLIPKSEPSLLAMLQLKR